jgi:hypothetical protein
MLWCVPNNPLCALDYQNASLVAHLT